MRSFHCQGEVLCFRTGVQFYLGKRIDNIELEETGTCARIDISQNAVNADQKVKWFLKVHKRNIPFWEVQIYLFGKFLFRFTF